MSDIVERLRKAAFRGPTMEAAHTKDIRWEAADLIEHLKAELKSANEAGERIAAALRNSESALDIVTERYAFGLNLTPAGDRGNDSA